MLGRDQTESGSGMQEVWDAIFLGKSVSKHCSVPPDKLQAMKDEFKFWYPFDLRVSGKDLIQNHLTFCLYNHTAIFPESNWPKAMRTNGHLLLNSDKMSKNTGNFLTLRQSIGAHISPLLPSELDWLQVCLRLLLHCCSSSWCLSSSEI